MKELDPTSFLVIILGDFEDLGGGEGLLEPSFFEVGGKMGVPDLVLGGEGEGDKVTTLEDWEVVDSLLWISPSGGFLRRLITIGFLLGGIILRGGVSLPVSSSVSSMI